MKLRLVFLFVIACLITVIQPVNAASFDCSKAKRPEERLICGDPKLSGLDGDLDKAYKEAHKNLSEEERKELTNEQQRWLKAWPLACSIGQDAKSLTSETITCSTLKYTERIDLLRKISAKKDKTIDIIPARLLGDFWGMELPVEWRKLKDEIQTEPYLDVNGVVVVRFLYSDDNNIAHTLFYHTKQKKIIYSLERVVPKGGSIHAISNGEKTFLMTNGLTKVMRAPFGIVDREEEFGDIYYSTSGHRWVSVWGEYGKDVCKPPLNIRLRVENNHGWPIAEKTVLYSSTRKITYHPTKTCSWEEKVFQKQRELTTKALYLAGVWAVDDGTVLASFSRAPYIVRLTPHLTSPFIDQHPDLCFFNGALLRHLADKTYEKFHNQTKATGKDIYGRIDDVLFYLVTQYQTEFSK